MNVKNSNFDKVSHSTETKYTGTERKDWKRRARKQRWGAEKPRNEIAWERCGMCSLGKEII